jgi:hypothetical protein
MGREEEEKHYVYSEVDMGNSYGEGFRNGYKEGFLTGLIMHKKEDEKKDVR